MTTRLVTRKLEVLQESLWKLSSQSPKSKEKGTQLVQVIQKHPLTIEKTQTKWANKSDKPPTQTELLISQTLFITSI